MMFQVVNCAHASDVKYMDSRQFCFQKIKVLAFCWTVCSCISTMNCARCYGKEIMCTHYITITDHGVRMALIGHGVCLTKRCASACDRWEMMAMMQLRGTRCV